MSMTERRNWLPVLLILLAALGYYLPWVWHPTAGLSPGAYDLAEWTTLAPSIRFGTPSLLPSLFLRGALGLLAILAVLLAATIASVALKWISRGLGVLFAVTLLPPLDFFTGAWTDPNYQQQIMIALGTLAVISVIIWQGHRIASRIMLSASAIIAGASLASALVGVDSGMELMQNLSVMPTVGGGIVLFGGTLGLCIVVVLWQWRQTQLVPT